MCTCVICVITNRSSVCAAVCSDTFTKMTSVYVVNLCKVMNFFARSEVRHCHNFHRQWDCVGQIFPVFKASSVALEQQTPICRSGTVTCISPLAASVRSRIFGNGSLHSLTRHLSHRPQGIRNFCTSRSKNKKEEITVNFLKVDGETISVKAKVGETLLDTVIDNDVDIDGFGACEGTLACSTCHLIFDEDLFEKLPEMLDEEEDMLDLAYGLSETSRLGCQIILTKEMDNMVVRVPEGIADARDV